MGTLRKYLLNGAIISSVLSGVSAFRQGRKNPSDWRTYLTWIAWLLTLAVALGTIRKESVDPDAPKVSAGPKLKNAQKKPKKGE
ncbi:hypothetical protein [uncultured Amnibacterium sp.]|uniref:hypothetical protein n=1 Tax=uncultured Amnibacterium sp. TaxID=1631851 RepID=UPI0035CAAFAA